MNELLKLFEQKDLITSAEQQVFWREELHYLLENMKEKDVLLQEMIDILNFFAFKNESRNLDKSLVEKFNLFFKYLKQPKEVLQQKIVDLVSLSDEMLSEKHKVPILHLDFYCSEELLNWARELYYLMTKLERNDEIIKNSLFFLKKARSLLTGEDMLKLKKNLKIFKDDIENYIDFK